MTLSEAAHGLLHMHHLDGAHSLSLTVFLGDFGINAKRKEVLFTSALPSEGDTPVDGNLVVEEHDFFDVVEQELPLAPRLGGPSSNLVVF